MRGRLIGIASLILGFVACRDTGVVGPMPIDDLRTTPLSVEIDGQELALTPYLWRDFMPSSPPDGKPLVALLRIQAADNATVSSGVHVDAVWVILGNDVWASDVTEERPRSMTEPNYEAVARNGPKWGPGVSVDVVVRVRDNNGGAKLLRAANQPISRTS